MPNVIRKPYVNQGLAVLANTDFVTFAAGTASTDLRTLQTGQAGRLLVEITTTGLVNLVVRETKSATTRSVGLVSVPGTAEMAVLNIPLDTSGGPSSTITYALQCSGATTVTKIQVTEIVGDDVESFTFAGAGSTLSPADVIAALAAATESLILTCADPNNYIPLDIRQNDTTNNPLGLRVMKAGTGSIAQFESTNAGAGGAVWETYANSPSPAAADVLADWSIYGEDSGGTKTEFARQRFIAAAVANPNEDATYQLALIRGGTLTTVLQVQGASGGSVTWTPAGAAATHGGTNTLAGSATEVELLAWSIAITSGTQSVAARCSSLGITFSGASVASGDYAGDTAPLGGEMYTNWDSTGTAAEIVGGDSGIEVGAVANGLISIGTGHISYFTHGGSGTVTTAYGGRDIVTLDAAGNITTGIGRQIEMVRNGAGNYTTEVGLRILAFGSGTTNNFGLDIGAITGTGAFAIRTSTGAVSFGDQVTISRAGNLLRATNTTDAVSNQVAIFEMDSATPAANDNGYLSFLLNDEGGVETEFGRIAWVSTVVTAGAEEGAIDFYYHVAGALSREVRFGDNAISPAVASGGSLGRDVLPWSALFISGQATWTAGAAVTAASYQVGRDADGTNQLHFNVPTGAGMEWSVNDVAAFTLTSAGILNASTNGIRSKQSIANVSNPPTDAELDAAFGTPATLGRGFIATIDDADGDTLSWLVWTTDTAWFYVDGALAV